MKKLTYTLVIVLTLLSCQTYACNCNPGGTIAANVQLSDYIVKAKILSISYTNRLDTMNVVSEGDPNNVFSKYWKFHVKIYKALIQETYKGHLSSDTVTIVTGMNGAACGLNLAVDGVYLIYGTIKDYQGFSSVQRKASDGKLFWTNNCTRSFDFSDEEAKDVKKEIFNQSYKE